MPSSAPILQLTRLDGVRIKSASALKTLRKEFDQQHYIRLKQFLEPPLLKWIQRQLDQIEFYNRSHPGVGKELCMPENVVLNLLEFLANDPKLFRIIPQLTGCKRIGCFTGRVYRMSYGQGHYDDWHSDLFENRLITMSINLSRQPYRGGRLKIRNKHTQREIASVANTRAGDAILFKISADLEHRVTDIEGSLHKTAFAGWFRSKPSFQSIFSRKSQ